LSRVHAIPENLIQRSVSGRSCSVAMSRTWNSFQSEPPEAVPYAKYRPSGETRHVESATVPSVERRLGSRSIVGSASSAVWV
jgi:hypothetical protein